MDDYKNTPGYKLAVKLITLAIRAVIIMLAWNHFAPMFNFPLVNYWEALLIRLFMNSLRSVD